jgi:hypothetical protein
LEFIERVAMQMERAVLNAKSNEVAMETLVICYERLERE